MKYWNIRSFRTFRGEKVMSVLGRRLALVSRDLLGMSSVCACRGEDQTHTSKSFSFKKVNSHSLSFRGEATQFKKVNSDSSSFQGEVTQPCQKLASWRHSDCRATMTLDKCFYTRCHCLAGTNLGKCLYFVSGIWLPWGNSLSLARQSVRQRHAFKAPQHQVCLCLTF